MNNIHDKKSVFKNTRAEWRFCYYEPGERMSGHHHDHAQFSLMLIGEQRETSKGYSTEQTSMTMALKPNNFFHENDYGDGGSLALSINLFDMGEVGREFDFAEWRVRDSARVKNEWVDLAKAMCATEPDEDTLNDLTDDLLTAMLDVENSPARTAPPTWLDRARQAIIETEASAEEIARDAGVHRVHLSRTFRRYYGISLNEQRRRARLERAATSIIRERSSIAVASYAAGFADQAHFTRTMGHHTGITPGALHRLFNVALT